jgi:hypothetical protein
MDALGKDRADKPPTETTEITTAQLPARDQRPGSSAIGAARSSSGRHQILPQDFAKHVKAPITLHSL